MSPNKHASTSPSTNFCSPSNQNSSPSNKNKSNKPPGTPKKRNESPHTPPNKSNKGLCTPTESSKLQSTPEKSKTSPYSQFNENDRSQRTPPRQKNAFTYPSPLSSTMNPADLPSSMQLLNHLPPLMNLTKKTMDSWNEIEAKNLESILESTKPLEVYVCDTTIRDIYQSFQENRLDISQRNMENIASSGGSRSKRFFILRVNTPESGRFIVGVASINQSAGVMKSHRRTGRYLVGVCYLAVSCPLLSELTAYNHFDGMEVYPNVYNRLLQQYKFQLNGKKTCRVRPLFPKISVSFLILCFTNSIIVFNFHVVKTRKYVEFF